MAATNWRAEQALRPTIVNRKTWGGNRTRRGADTQQVLSSILATAANQHRDPSRSSSTSNATPPDRR